MGGLRVFRVLKFSKKKNLLLFRLLAEFWGPHRARKSIENRAQSTKETGRVEEKRTEEKRGRIVGWREDKEKQ